jgi:predicted HNH restriction endonuclease
MAFPRPPSVAAYRAAFLAVRPKMTPIQWKMLEAQFLGPDHMVTAGELATAAGSHTYRTTNVAYSALGRRLRHVLARPVRTGHALVGIFSEFMPPDQRNPYWRFVMRRPAVLALKSLGWFDEDSNVTASSLAHARTRAAAEEGRIQKRLSVHRSRERSLRAAKLAAAIAKSPDGHLRCEVPGCGFDFEAVYGKLGAGFAEVHHLRPLAQMDGPVETTLGDLAVVCANCHRMIHLGGECRKMTGLVR